jgi:hypothetical protein
VLVIFEIGSHFMSRPALDGYHPVCASLHSWDGSTLCLSQTLYLGWPWTIILPICAFQIARITGLNHHGRTQILILYMYYYIRMKSLWTINFVDKKFLNFVVFQMLDFCITVESRKYSSKIYTDIPKSEKPWNLKYFWSQAFQTKDAQPLTVE